MLYLFIDFISGDETTMNPSAYFEALFTLAADIPEYTVTKVSQKTFVKYHNVKDLNQDFYENWENHDETEPLDDGQKVAYDWFKV